MNITSQTLKDRYKNIKVMSVGEIEVVDLYRDKEDLCTYHVRLMFAFNKLFITGDYGSFIFGKDICHIYEFFKGKDVNLGYWKEKCESSPAPIINEEIDIEKADFEIRKFYEEYVDLDDLTDEEKEDFEYDLDNLTHGPFPELDTNMYRAYDSIENFLRTHYAEDYGYEYVSDIIDQSRDWNPQYEYICNVIQWVENNLNAWRLEAK